MSHELPAITAPALPTLGPTYTQYAQVQQQVSLRAFFTQVASVVNSIKDEVADTVRVSKNSGAVVGTRTKLNFIEGSNITLTIADDSANEEVDITIAASGLSDGDKGDITVSSSGTTWTIDNSAVTLAKMANLAASSIIGNSTGGAATPTALSIAAGMATFFATPSSANLAAALTDETGSGAAVFANTPTLVTPNIGAATGTSLAVTGVLTSSGGGIGYVTGAGGTVVQATNKSTGVTLDKLTGTITMNGAALGSQTTVTFTLTNSFVAATDFVAVQHASVGTLGAYNFAVAPAAGSVAISVRNVHTFSLSEAIVLRFIVFKAVTS